MRKTAKNLLICLSAFGMALCSITAFSPDVLKPVEVYASLEDDVGSVMGDLANTEISRDDENVADWIGNQRGMTSENLADASRLISPLTNMIGYLVGGITILIFVGIFGITALDLLYISIPPVRNMLYKPAQQGMNGMGGAKPRQWVSDEAVLCATLLGADSAQQGQGRMPYGPGAGGFGPYGPAGGAQMPGQQQQEPMAKKSVIGIYFKNRVVFMILLVIATVVLTSSVLLGTGANLAKWALKLIEMFNGYIA